METKRITGRARVERNRRILRANNVCHICGHAGSDSIDHVVALHVGGTEDPSNLRPAHHEPCPTCGHRCNRAKSDKPYAPIVRTSRAW